MPYRRLPNTDTARLKALNTAHQKGKELPPFKLSFSQNALQKIQTFLPSYEKAMLEQKMAYQNQINKNKEYQGTQKKARLYISHFVQVVNMAIQRCELPADTRKFYRLEAYDGKVPSLNSEDEIMHWGEKLIEGERQRCLKGLGPVTNPTIAVVQVRYDQFKEAFRHQKNLQNINNRALKKLAALRKQADQIIVQVWNEVEDSFKDLPEQLKREKATEYGVIYVYRKNETDRLQSINLSRQETG